MEAKNFLKEMEKALRDFEGRAQDYGNIVEETIFECGNGILYLSCTVEDENGECYSCSQEFEVNEDELCPLWFHCN